jgi:hypothetical protein
LLAAIVVDLVTLAILCNIAFRSAVAFVLGGCNQDVTPSPGMGTTAIGLIAASAALRVL